MDHMSHSHHDHHYHHMPDQTNVTDHSSHLPSLVLNSTVANVTSVLMLGLQDAAETMSNIATNLTDTGSMDHSSHHNHNAHPVKSGMTMDGMSTTTMNMDHGMSGMQMYFHFGCSETILFYGWKISTVGGLIGSMLGIFCIAIIYEAIKYFREFLFKKSLREMQLYTSAGTKGGLNQPSPALPLQYLDQILLPTTLTLFSTGHMIQTLLHMLQFVISYCLMLIFMTYNVWLCLALTLGAGLGYFMFGWKKSVVVDVTEHCH